jgi:hypothetical protein
MRLEQFRAKLEKDDFSLNSKDDKDKIKKAEDLLTGELDDAIKDWGDDNKILDELDKHVIQLGNYSPPKASI